jgi:hypothetical protein
MAKTAMLVPTVAMESQANKDPPDHRDRPARMAKRAHREVRAK